MIVRDNFGIDQKTMPIDAQQLAKLIEDHAGSLRLWIKSHCASSDDVVQEAFCKLLAQHPQPEQPVAWLYKVCRNLAEKQRLADARRRKREREYAHSEVTSNKSVESCEMTSTLKAVESLDQALREVLVARLWGQLSLEEIGKLCGISTTTAFRRYESALQALRTKLSLTREERT